NSSISDNLFFYDQSISAFRGGELEASDAWSPSSLGTNSFAYGKNVKANGINAIALGGQNITNGNNGFTFGLRDTVEGVAGSGAIGVDNFSGGDFGAITIGKENQLLDGSDNGSIILGNENIMQAEEGAIIAGSENTNGGSYGSIVMGYKNQSIADSGSVTLGKGLTNNYDDAIVLGQYNAYSNYTLEPTFVIGNGTTTYDSDPEKHDAFSILKNGYTGVNYNYPQDMFTVRNTGQLPREGIYLLGDVNTNKHVRIILDNPGTNGKRWSIVSTGNGALLGDGKFAIRNVNQDKEVITIDSTLKVGIGNVNPEWDLDLKANSGSVAGMRIDGSNSTNRVTMRFSNNAFRGRTYSISSSGGGAGVGRGKFAVRDETSGDNRFVIDSTGKVAIGYDNPSEQLDLNGAVRLKSSPNNNPGTIQYADNKFQGYNGSEWIDFGPNPVPDLTDSDGDTQVMVEKTSDEDIIRFDLDGETKFKIENSTTAFSRINYENNGANLILGSGKAVVGRDSSNIFLGSNIATNRTESKDNIFIGNNVGLQGSGSDIISIGHGSLENANISTDNIIAIGNNAFSNLSFNDVGIAIGNNAGRDATRSGLFIGNRAGDKNEANGNTFLGNQCGEINSTGSNNTFVGEGTALFHGMGSFNVMIGSQAGQNDGSGVNNVYIGHQAAITNNTGQNNTIIGSQADMTGNYFSSIAIG
ncbi:MAG: hypothetical protein AAGK97_08110, partial [Bacteroidota bacterium]